MLRGEKLEEMRNQLINGPRAGWVFCCCCLLVFSFCFFVVVVVVFSLFILIFGVGRFQGFQVYLYLFAQDF